MLKDRIFTILAFLPPILAVVVSVPVGLAAAATLFAMRPRTTWQFI